MTYHLTFKLPKENYSIVEGPCSITSRKCKQFLAENEEQGTKLSITTKDDDAQKGKISLCKDNNGEYECTKLYAVKDPTMCNKLFDDNFNYISVLLDHGKGYFKGILDEFNKYNIDYTVMDDGETQNVLSEDFII